MQRQPHSAFLRRWLGPALIAIAAAIMADVTWGTWPDPIVDFGKEIYLSWQLSLGARLYTDVAYHLGPLSPYLNALVFRYFGPTLATIEWFNLLLLGVTTALLYRIIHRIAGAFAATISGLTFILLFAFSHYTRIADYNYICPYDYAHTQGLLLGLIGLSLADLYKRNGRLWTLIATGLVLGLTFLTRAELFVAAAAGISAILFWRPPPPTPSSAAAEEGRGEGLPPLSKTFAFAASFLIPSLIAFTFLGIHGVLGSWPSVIAGSVVGNRFYRDSMGTLDLPASLSRLTKWAFCWALIVLPAVVAARFWPKKITTTSAPNSPSPGNPGEGRGGGSSDQSRQNPSPSPGVPGEGTSAGTPRFTPIMILAIILAAIWGGGVAFLSGYLQDPADAFAPLPVALLACMAFGWWRMRKNLHPSPLPEYMERGNEEYLPSLRASVPEFTRRGGCLRAFFGFSLFSLALLGKILLNARIYHYGFVLAMPATILIIAISIGWTRPPVRAAVLGALAVTITAHLWLASNLMSEQSYLIGSGPDQFRADARGKMLGDMLEILTQSAKPGQTLAVMPEGAMLNFLSGLNNSTPYWSFNPPYAFFAPGQGEAAGQARILASVEAHPPDWIVLIAKDHSEFSDNGRSYFFGRDFGRDIDAYVEKNYTPVATLGQPRYTPNGFGMILMRRMGYNGVPPRE